MGRKNHRISFYLIFAGLGLLISFGVCTLMYVQFDAHIKKSYFDTLADVAIMIEKNYPVLYDIDKLKKGAENDEDWFWDTSRELNNIRTSFGLAYIYYIDKTEGEYLFRMSASVSRDYHPEWIGGPVWTVSDVPWEMDEAWETQKIAFSPQPTNEEEWGIMVSAILPLIKDGKTIGLLGVDYDISYIQTLEKREMLFLIVSFAASSLLISLLAFIGSHSVMIPIEDQKRIAQEAVDNNRKIEALMLSLKGAMESKHAFMTTVTDEMSRPISAIIESSSLMLEDDDISQDHHINHLELINDSGVILFNAISEILEISKLESGKTEIRNAEYELPSLISDITSLYTSHLVDNKVRFDIVLDDGLPFRLLGDELHIKKICHKLLTNAFKYTSKGTITFKVSCKREKGFVWLFIRISDTGIGMTKKDLDNLLTTDYEKINVAQKLKTEGTTGLGLYIVKRIAEIMKGSLLAASEQGKGSAFTLRVPQKQTSAETIETDIIEQLRRFQYSKKEIRNNNLIDNDA
jgi:signal transduction histidine kinase